MRVDIVIGNPPYQDMGNSLTGVTYTSCYHRFIDVGIETGRKVSLLVPSRWIHDKPKGVPDKWLDAFRTRNDFVSLVDYSNEKDVFDNVKITGGVCYFLISLGNTSKVARVYIGLNGERQEWLQDNLMNSCGSILRNKRAIDIVEKIQSNGSSLSEFISSSTPFQADRESGIFASNWGGFSYIKRDGYIKYYTKQAKEGYGWVNPYELHKGVEMVHKEKVLIPLIVPSDNRVLSEPWYGGKDSCCSSSFAVLCGDSILPNKEACEVYMEYLRTKFVRFLVQCVKSTQHISAESFKLIPVIDYREYLGLHYKEMDNRLYRKYQLNDADIAFIESGISNSLQK